MARRTEAIKGIAETLIKEGKTATFEQLGKALNELGLKTTSGNDYSDLGGRGKAKIVNDAYKELDQKGDYEGAKKVADAFTDKNGNHPWDK